MTAGLGSKMNGKDAATDGGFAGPDPPHGWLDDTNMHPTMPDPNDATVTIE